MILSLQDKQKIVTEIREISRNAISAVVVNPCGITVNTMTTLRKSGRESGICIRIVRNTLLRRIVEGTDFECLRETFVGPTLIAYSMKHPGSAARLFKEFTKENVKFEIKAAAFEGKFIHASQIDRLASLPTYKEALTNFIVIIKEISIGKLFCILSSLRGKKENLLKGKHPL